MHIKSPERTRRIRNSTLVGAFVGFMLGLVLRAVNGHWYGAILFTVIGAVMAAATAYMASDTSLE